MKIKYNNASIGAAVMVFCAILTTVNCYGGQKPNPLSNNKSQKGKVHRFMNKAFGFTPRFKTNDANKLLKLVLNEADLIKLAAYRQLKTIYKENSNATDKKQIFFELIQCAAELVRYYGTTKNLLKIKITYDEGKRYAAKCMLANTDETVKGECLKWKAVLIEAYFFSNRIASNRFVRKSFKIAYDTAKKSLGKDSHLEYLNIKMSCKVKLKAQGKSSTPKKSSMLMGNTMNEQNLDCVSNLLRYENSIHSYESYIGEYYNLVGRTFAKDGKTSKALEYFYLAREAPVVDQKSRNINKQVQTAIENIYLRERSINNNIV